MNLTYGPGAALVTGGSGGIGSCIVRMLATAGVPVGFTYRTRREAADHLVSELPAPARAATYAWGSSDAKSAEGLVRQVSADLGSVRFLVLNAGVVQESAFHTLAEPRWREIIETNLTSAIAVARGAVIPMMKAGTGRIVFISSVSGIRGIKGHTIYAATKAGLDGLTRSLAQECAGFGVTVNSVAPGMIDTPLLDAMPGKARDELLSRIPMGRLGRPEEVAGLACYLLSERAAYVTGQTWVIDGGLSS